MRVQVAGRHLRHATDDGLNDGVMDEDVLILRLNHIVALRPQARDMPIDVDDLFVLHSLQHRIDDDVAAGSTHSSRAVNDHGSGFRWRESATPTQELQERSRMIGHTMIRPGGELQLLDLTPIVEALPAQLERPDAVGGQLLRLRDGHKDLAIGLRSASGPVLVALNACSLLQSRHHHNGGRFQFPAHAPEVHKGFLQRSLGGHIGVVLPIAITVVGINVVRPNHTLHWRQLDTGMIVGCDIGIAILRFIVLQIGVVPGELLARLNALVLLRELLIVVGFEAFDMVGELRNGYGRMGDHAGCLEVQTPHVHGIAGSVECHEWSRHSERIETGSPFAILEVQHR